MNRVEEQGKGSPTDEMVVLDEQRGEEMALRNLCDRVDAALSAFLALTRWAGVLSASL